jgi:hypothetical protein
MLTKWLCTGHIYLNILLFAGNAVLPVRGIAIKIKSWLDPQENGSLHMVQIHWRMSIIYFKYFPRQVSFTGVRNSCPFVVHVVAALGDTWSLAYIQTCASHPALDARSCLFTTTSGRTTSTSLFNVTNFLCNRSTLSESDLSCAPELTIIVWG